MKFYTDIHGSQRMNHDDFGDTWTLSSITNIRSSFSLMLRTVKYLSIREMDSHSWFLEDESLLGVTAIIECFKTFQIVSYDFLNPWVFAVLFCLKYLNNSWMDCHEIWYEHLSSSGWFLMTLVIALKSHWLCIIYTKFYSSLLRQLAKLV